MVAVWEKASIPALAQASRILREFSGLDVEVRETSVASVAWDTVAGRVNTHVAEPLYAVHIGAQGLFDAQLLLLFSEVNSQRLAAAMLGDAVALPLSDLALSALAEVGNVVGTAFLNVFADLFGAVWEPTPPHVYFSPTGQWLRNVRPGTTVLVTEALFRITDEAVFGEIMVIPLLKEGAGGGSA